MSPVDAVKTQLWPCWLFCRVDSTHNASGELWVPVRTVSCKIKSWASFTVFSREGWSLDIKPEDTVRHADTVFYLLYVSGKSSELTYTESWSWNKPKSRSSIGWKAGGGVAHQDRTSSKLVYMDCFCLEYSVVINAWTVCGTKHDFCGCLNYCEPPLKPP